MMLPSAFVIFLPQPLQIDQSTSSRAAGSSFPVFGFLFLLRRFSLGFCPSFVRNAEPLTAVWSVIAAASYQEGSRKSKHSGGRRQK
jgi:hypothetical protein